MKLILLALVAACGAHTGPVPGAAEAREHHYSVSVADARAALHDVLAARYGGIASEDDRHVVANGACRTERGNECVAYPASTSADTQGPPAATGDIVSTADLTLQIYGGVAGADGDVTIQLGGRTRDHDGHDHEITAESPEPIRHEVDEVRLAVDAKLAQKR